MAFKTNADGSLSITWTAPAVVLSGSAALLNQTTPLPLVTNSAWPTAIVTDGFQIQGVLHTQFGADPTNTITDFRKTISFTKDALGNLTIPAFTQTQTIPLSVLASPLAGDGIYTIGYVGVGWNDGVGASGTLYLAYDYGTTAQNYRPTPPSMPGLVTAKLLNGNQIQVSWPHALAGAAPIAGYRLRWGTNRGGPYPNVLNLPISQFPIGTTNGYVYVFAVDALPFNGSSYFFTVEAYDDGTAPSANLPVLPQSISYFPGPIAASAVGTMSTITNYSSGKLWFGK